MKKLMCHTLAMLGMVIMLFVTGCDNGDRSVRRKALEDHLNVMGQKVFETGKQRLPDDLLEFDRRAQAAGLITLREIPESYWGSFLSQTQGMGTPVEITPTQKLLTLAGATPDPRDAAAGRNLLVRVSSFKIDQVTTDEKYKGQLAQPGEEYRILLGTYREIPTAAAAVVPFSPKSDIRRRFRVVMK